MNAKTSTMTKIERQDRLKGYLLTAPAVILLFIFTYVAEWISPYKVAELQQLVRKLEAIERKGGLKSLEEKPEDSTADAVIVHSWFGRTSIVS